MLAILQRGLGGNSGDAGCYLAVIPLFCCAFDPVSSVFGAFVTALGLPHLMLKAQDYWKRACQLTAQSKFRKI
jgi:hypothetical protein